MTALFLAARALALTQVNLELVLGLMTTGKEDAMAWKFGLAWFVVIGGLIAFVYAGLFRGLGRSGWRIGGLIGFIHAFLAAYAYQNLLILPAYFPELPVPSALLVPEKLGFENGDWTGVLMLVSHSLYGAIVGGLIHRLQVSRSRRIISTWKTAA